jgi:chaperonin GroES
MTNDSGIYPSGDRILIKPSKVETKTPGGIEIPDHVVDHYMMGQTDGVLVAVGPDAWDDVSGPYAKIGERVMFAKYGGQRVWGKDGEEYRMMNDKDITARLDEGVTFTEFQARVAISKQGK